MPNLSPQHPPPVLPMAPIDTPPGVPNLLPGEDEPTERADAARNRRILLETARELVREQGVAQLTMDALAARAGVGKGTVFRRFGDRAGLMLALLDHSSRVFQEAFMFGPPPLGPGAPPVERLVAFARARLRDLTIESELHLVTERQAPEKWYGASPYILLKIHLTLLLRQANAPGDPALLADSLLATMSAGLAHYQIQTLGYSQAHIGEHWETLIRRIVTP